MSKFLSIHTNVSNWIQIVKSFGFFDDFSELFTFLLFLDKYQDKKKFLWSQLVTIEIVGKQSYMDARKAAKFSSPKQLKKLTAQSSHWSIAKRFG
jgi:hypothetical protein